MNGPWRASKRRPPASPKTTAPYSEGPILPRESRAHENKKRTAARRMHALARLDLREPSTPRETAIGPTSHAVKKIDIGTRAAIDAFLRERQNG